MAQDPSAPLIGVVDHIIPVDESQKHLTGDSVTTQAELIRNELENGNEPPRKKAKLDTSDGTTGEHVDDRDRRKGIAPVKPEFLVKGEDASGNGHTIDDDAAEGRQPTEGAKGKKRQKQKGQNKARTFGSYGEARSLCSTRVHAPEFSPEQCKFGDSCRFEHDLRKYLKEHKRADLETFHGRCPLWAQKGKCPSGFKCRFLGSHMEERTVANEKHELVLIEDPGRIARTDQVDNDEGVGVVNVVTVAQKIELAKRQMKMPKSDAFTKWLDANKGDPSDPSHALKEHRAEYREPPFLPSEKRKVYFGRDTPALAPLTTQGNLPYRRLCVALGAQLTYSEMAMSMPLIQGQKSEWALLKAHRDEIAPPKYGGSPGSIVKGYDNSKDMKFGAQIAGNKPWNICKATEIITALCPSLRLVDLNCGCPIDLVYDHGAGSALLDSPGKLEKMLMGMNAVSGEVPVTVKIRLGTRDKEPTALKLVNRLVNGARREYGADPDETSVQTSGVAAITLHGRSRQQRYSRSADWEYIAQCAALIKRHQRDSDELADTVREVDPRDKPAAAHGKVFFLGNGDCYSHVDYYNHLDNAGVDSVMIGRGALVKPWLFEEIEKGQHLDKSATERLGYIEQYVKFGLETWGSDELGVGTTRRFLLEWLSFAHRYVPAGLLEHLPPSLQDRPPKYRGRNELETLMASDNYKDWIKISEMFLGKAGDGFMFQPKHKSNSYDYNAEG